MASLIDIEKAIRANFVLNPDGKMYLEADPVVERDFKAAARIVFVGTAIAHGYKAAEICEHINMTLFDFNSKALRFRQHYRSGEEKARSKPHNQYQQKDAFDGDLRIYRKYNLVRNYLNNLARQAIYL